MAWLGHKDSEMIHIYYHLHDAESKRQMNQLDFLGGSGGRSAGNDCQISKQEDVGATFLKSAAQ